MLFYGCETSPVTLHVGTIWDSRMAICTKALRVFILWLQNSSLKETKSVKSVISALNILRYLVWNLSLLWSSSSSWLLFLDPLDLSAFIMLPIYLLDDCKMSGWMFGKIYQLNGYIMYSVWRHLGEIWASEKVYVKRSNMDIYNNCNYVNIDIM